VSKKSTGLDTTIKKPEKMAPVQDEEKRTENDTSGKLKIFAGGTKASGKE
jgi:hypothetical protein